MSNVTFAFGVVMACGLSQANVVAVAVAAEPALHPGAPQPVPITVAYKDGTYGVQPWMPIMDMCRFKLSSRTARSRA